ncbi:MAG: hypothetical protein FJ303_03935 [Planctomycetes bacterium]|nr:hypothetical protein [Planctomycetota bacterium]
MMECHEVQQLLAFVDRKCGELDDTEREIVQQHLDKCPACAELARAERQFDALIAPVMVDVPVPTTLHQNILAKLDADRGRVPWKTALAMAACLLIAVTAGWVWFQQTHPELKSADVPQLFFNGNQSVESVEGYLADRGVDAKLPGIIDGSLLEEVDVVHVKGKPVAKFTYLRIENGQKNKAYVLALSPRDFRLGELTHGMKIANMNSVFVHHEDGYVFIVYCSSLEAFRQFLKA